MSSQLSTPIPCAEHDGRQSVAQVPQGSIKGRCTIQRSEVVCPSLVRVAFSSHRTRELGTKAGRMAASSAFLVLEDCRSYDELQSYEGHQ